MIGKWLANFRDDWKRLELTLTECTIEIDRLREIMKADDIEIAANFAKTDALIEEMKAARSEDEKRWKKP